MRRVALALALMTATPALAVLPDEQLADPVLEARARELSKELRCVVCQNQSIDDSDADLARDLRLLVRERLQAGDSDQAVKDYLVARYGSFVLLRPPMTGGTMLLWFGPLVVVLLGGAGVAVYLTRRRREGVEPAPLDAGEEADLNRLMREEDEHDRERGVT